MLWVKALHVVFVVSWYAGLLYLPRLFVYHADCDDKLGAERFVVMERKLFGIMTLAAALAWLLGAWLLVAYAWMAYAGQYWLVCKLALLVALTGFHVSCYRHMLKFRHGKNTHTGRYFRWYNEMPAILLILIVILVVVKPF